MAAKIDEQIKKITDFGYETAVKILTRLRKKLDVIAEELLRKETIDADDFIKLLGPKKAIVPAKA
jgi:ATP-dependent Zn protease